MASTKEVQEKLIADMRKWQKIEDASVSSTAAVIQKTSNPLIRTVMEIIQRDSMMHYRVQGLIADSYDRFPVTLEPEELADVWGAIENHIAIEKKMVGAVRETLEAVKGKKMVVAEYLLNYLKRDEDKHDELLADLEKVKKGMYPGG